MTETLKDLDAGTYDITTIYQDPRRGVVVDGGKARVYVISFPDREAAKKWGEENGIKTSKFWEKELERLKVQEPHISLALALPKAPKKILDAIAPPIKRSERRMRE